MKVALLSDTHGILRPEIFDHLEGVEQIVHSGDVGPPDLLVELEAVAPVTAVWGNTDGFPLRHRVDEVARREWAGQRVVVIHGHQLGTPRPEPLASLHPDADLIVFGHTHRPLIQTVGTVLVVNPGSCGPRRFDLDPTLVLARIEREGIETRLVRLREV